MGSKEQELKDLAEMGCRVLGIKITGSMNGLPLYKDDAPYRIYDDQHVVFDPEDLNQAWKVFFGVRATAREGMLSGRMIALYNAFGELYGHSDPKSAALALLRIVRATEDEAASLTLKGGEQ